MKMILETAYLYSAKQYTNVTKMFFNNVTGFHGMCINVILFTNIRKVRSPLRGL